MRLRLGTRASLLARTQAGGVADQLRTRGIDVELVPMTSDGDRTAASLATLGGTGVFAAALRQALLEGRCDAVVHSFKDLPTAPQPGLRIAAVPQRADHHDVLCGPTPLAQLPHGARIGTGSPRRRAQLLAARSDLEVVDIRGNVDTRLALVRDGQVAAVVLAAAGLARIDRMDAVADLLPWPTAPAQGALAIEIRDDDHASAAAVAALEHRPTRDAVTAERTVLAQVEAGCAAPLAVTAVAAAGVLELEAIAYRADGSEQHAVRSAAGDSPERLGADVARSLLAAGIADWLGP